MKHFFRHWQYGIKARVIDGALVADIDTAREHTFVRLDLARLQTVALDIVAKPGDYELTLVNVGAPGASTTLAKFEVKDAAEEAACSIRRALLRGSQTHRFRRAFKTTLGILAALALVTALLGVASKLDGSANNQTAAMQSLLGNLQNAGQTTGATVPAANNGQAVPAEQFLSGVQAPPTE